MKDEQVGASVANTGFDIEKLSAFFKGAANVEAVLNDKLRQHGINIRQVILLNYVRENPECSGQDIRRNGYFGSNVSYNLKTLMTLDFIVQTADEFDKRTKNHSLTEEGKQKLESCLASLGCLDVDVGDAVATVSRGGAQIHLR